MPKFLLIETWNGEGYSDSRAAILDFPNFKAALDEALKQAQSMANDAKDAKVVNYNTVEYAVREDQGAIHVTAFLAQYGACLRPDTNQYELFDTRKSYIAKIIEAASDNECDEDDIAELVATENGCVHTSNGCLVFQKFAS